MNAPLATASLKLTRRLQVPTGEIMVVQGSCGPLELVSLGDYGKEVNLTRQPVPNGLPTMPLTKKWVVTISTQYGCSMGCQFCDVPRVGVGYNATYSDLVGQVVTAIEIPGVPRQTERLNVHFARMGEPTLNPNVLLCALWLRTLKGYNPHPVVSTMMPRGRANRHLRTFLRQWMMIKNDVYGGNAGLQLSINSTDEAERAEMFHGNAATLEECSSLMDEFRPKGRKITLNFAVAGYTINCERLADLFPPSRYIVKLTPLHKTQNATLRGIKTAGDYTSPEPYLELEERFNKAGFETLVFIASEDEDAGLITCGNAILSGSLPHKYIECECLP